MLEYCSKCGSLIINGICTRKNCSSNKQNLASPSKVRTSKAKSPVAKPATKSTKVPRASKCITYKISDLPQVEE